MSFDARRDTLMIDLHTHVFNAAYLPLEGILRARGLAPEVAGPIARFLEAVVEHEETREDSEIAQALANFQAGQRHATSDWISAFNQADDPLTLLAASVDAALLEAHAAGIEEALRHLLADPRTLTLLKRDFSATAVSFGGLHPAGLRRKLLSLLRGVAKLMRNGIVLMEWLALLLRRESAIVEQLLAIFPRTKLFVHHALDLGPHYEAGRCRHSFDTQLQRMHVLSERFEGRLLPFIAWSPFRPDGLAIVKEWLGRGFAGVTFHPPSGYRPRGNSAHDLGDAAQDPAVIDARNLELFRYCAREGAPILAHCQPGEFEHHVGAGCLSHPDAWRRVLATPGLEKLRLCLAQAGGEGWTAPKGREDEESNRHCPHLPGFVASAVDLCIQHENVYLAFGSLETLLRNPLALDNLTQGLRNGCLRHGARFGRRLIYASEWQVLGRTPGITNCQPSFRKLFQDDPVLRHYETDFFTRNALRFLDLPAYLARSEGRIGDTRRQWLQRLDAGRLALVG